MSQAKIREIIFVRPSPKRGKLRERIERWKKHKKQHNFTMFGCSAVVNLWVVICCHAVNLYIYFCMLLSSYVNLRFKKCIWESYAGNHHLWNQMASAFWHPWLNTDDTISLIHIVCQNDLNYINYILFIFISLLLFDSNKFYCVLN